MSKQRVLVVGGGSIGERHARCFLATDRAEVSVCDLSPEIRSKLEERYPLQATYADLDDALGQPWDAAVICTPAHLHVTMALRFLQGETAVLIEKPLSVSDEGVDALQAASEQRSVAVAYVLRQNAALQSMRTAIRSGRFGKPLQVVGVSGQHFPFYRPAYREIYYVDRATGGGAIQDALTHQLNAAEWIVGPITRLVADADHCALAGVTVEDTAHVMTRHNQLLGSFVINQHQYANESTLTVHCESGSARIEFHRGRWMYCEQPDGEWLEEMAITTRRDELFERQAAAFLDYVQGRRENLCSVAEARQTMRAAIGAIQSWETGQWVNLR